VGGVSPAEQSVAGRRSPQDVELTRNARRPSVPASQPQRVLRTFTFVAARPQGEGSRTVWCAVNQRRCALAPVRPELTPPSEEPADLPSADVVGRSLGDLRPRLWASALGLAMTTASKPLSSVSVTVIVILLKLLKE
jgi:hypothetical protein